MTSTGRNLYYLLLSALVVSYRNLDMHFYIDIIEKKRLHWYGHVKRMSEESIPKLIMEWIPQERRKRGRPRKTWMEGVQAAMTTRNLEPDQRRNRDEWRLVSRRRRQLL
jgi:hypothetical protein